MQFPFGQEITLIFRTPGNTDEYGDETGTATEETVLGAFSPKGSAEANGTGIVTQPTVYIPPRPADLTFLDAVRVAGITYEIDGAPIVWDNPFTSESFGVEVRLTGRET
ncbi:MAG: hypothetical protein HOV76_14670 [Hamadaea sp.]|nr:hypothetical protein [Hamadaea sp.]